MGGEVPQPADAPIAVLKAPLTAALLRPHTRGPGGNVGVKAQLVVPGHSGGAGRVPLPPNASRAPPVSRGPLSRQLP